MESPAGKVSRAFSAWIALSADSGFLDDRMALTADFFRLGEAVLGDVARPHVMAVIGPFRMSVGGACITRGDGHTWDGIAEKMDVTVSVQARIICFMTSLSF